MQNHPSFILCGSLRSGTTLTRLLLQQHPEIKAYGESDFYFDAFQQSIADTNVNQFHHKMAEVIKFDRSVQSQNITLNLHDQIQQTLDDICAQQQVSGQHLFLTLHRNFHIAAEAFPKAKFLKLNRDPRDVAISSMKMGWGGNPYYGMDSWLIAESSWVKAAPMLDKSQIIDFSFEELTTSPEQTLRRLLKEMDLEFNTDVLTPKNTTYSAPHAQSTQAWKSKLSDQQVAEMNWRLGALGRDSGYDVSQVQKPNLLRRGFLWAESNYKRHRQSIRYYGLRLWTKSHFVKRFGSVASKEKIHFERERVIAPNLK